MSIEVKVYASHLKLRYNSYIYSPYLSQRHYVSVDKDSARLEPVRIENKLNNISCIVAAT